MITSLDLKNSAAMPVILKETMKYSTYSSKDSQLTSWKLYSYPPFQWTIKGSNTKPSKSLDLGCWSKASLKPEGRLTLEASIKEVATSNDLCTNQVDPSKADDQDSSVAAREDKETSSTNNAAQASVPKVEDKEGHNSIPPMHPGGWPINPSQWT